MATNLVNSNSDLKATTRVEIEKAVAELTDFDYSKIKLNVYRGRYFAVFGDVDKKLVYVEDPDDGSNKLLKLEGGQTGWYFVDAIAHTIKHVPSAVHVMAWEWDEAGKQYLPARSKYVNATTTDHKDAEGILDHYIRRKSGSNKTVSTIAGVGELQYIGSRVAEYIKALRGTKADPKKGVVEVKGKMPAEAPEKLVFGVVQFFKAMNLDENKLKSELAKAWPELFNPVKK